jgi:superfamily II DNA/RNA helicase
MLDMGFKPAVDRIVRQMPGDRQTLFFSATLEGAAGKLAAAYTRDPRRHVHRPKVEKGAEVKHRFIHLSHEAKLDALVGELRHSERGRTLVFVRTKRGADRLVKRLAKQQVRAIAMHGDKSQGQRQRALAGFERGDHDTLIATDVASRGIDVDEITHVINFDAPEDRDVYVHRTGRTGRAGASGIAASFVLPDQHREMRKIATELGLHKEFDSGPGFEHAARQHPGNGGGGGKSSNGNGRSNRRSRNSGNGGPRTYSARPKGSRRRRR